ncbi:hypothetical protein LEP1GSC060_1337 [Leptospira weilii serovar Ranarum str. ICFT]|uniref:Uncharacterized protein n=1 Tax=Leptospira weilii serovar Ranarum str. ICFT TaxID=1218598 RepID=N1WM49_9LEPT|nr:hypothetical protein LEP1GSC060_1337 [Leptospira weilii serovar Ranarum str. ICFT]
MLGKIATWNRNLVLVRNTKIGEENHSNSNDPKAKYTQTARNQRQTGSNYV